MPLASGAVFAGYTILGFLRTDAIGDVYLAQHSQLCRYDALKVLFPGVTSSRGFHERFRQETAIAATVSHPHVARFYAGGEWDGNLWTATEYVNGTTAAQLLHDQFPVGMPVGEALAVVAAVAAALDYLHRYGLLHRNVGPGSILLTQSTAQATVADRRILLTDFGIGSGTDRRSDQYSLAATAFHLLTGEPPFADAGPAAMVGRALHVVPPRLSDRRPEAACLDEVLATALSQNPGSRFGSCQELADTLNRHAVALTAYRDSGFYAAVLEYPRDSPAAELPGISGLPAATAPPSRSASAEAVRRRRARIFKAAGVTAICIAVLTAGIIIGRNSGATSQSDESPTQDIRPPGVVSAPATAAPHVPDSGETLDGSYRVDVNRAKQTYNETPSPQPPNVSTWWAFRTSCTSGRCVATGVLLDDADHQNASAKEGDNVLVLDFRDGGWQSRPDSVQFPCVGPHGTPARQSTTQTISLRRAAGLLRGEMVVDVHTDECGQAGAQIRIPAVAERIGDVPAGVSVAQNPP